MEILIPLIAVLAFLAILFTQSGLDKVFDFKGNMEWLTGHFANSPLAPLTKPMVVVLTLLELASGVISILAVVMLLNDAANAHQAVILALSLCSLSFLSLFFGQRMAKDYAGAASIPAYFVVALVGFILLFLMK